MGVVGGPMSDKKQWMIYGANGFTGRLIAAQWDPWPFDDAIKEKIDKSDIYTLRRIVPKDRGFTWGDR